MNNTITLESNKRLSTSSVWQAQREYYDTQGIEAWAEEVPCYITTNPFIAHAYASVVFAYMQDWQNGHKDYANEPFYCVEIGAGHGQFGFYFLKAIIPMLKAANLPLTSVRYVMTDFTESNIAFWQQHQSLQGFIQEGMLDFAKFDFENDDQLELKYSSTILSSSTIHKPVTLFANYLFDSIVNDAFYVKDGELFESLVDLTTDSANYENDQPKKWEKVIAKYHNSPIRSDYYDDPLFNDLLNQYKSELDDTYISFPVGSLQGIKNMMKIANGNVLVLSSDKGYTKKDELENQEPPELTFHGSFSLMVNFDAIERYAALTGGASYFPRSVDGFVSGAASFGEDIVGLPQVKNAINTHVLTFGPAEYFCLYEQMEQVVSSTNLKTIASFLALSRWDPYIFSMFSDRISDIIEDADQDCIDYLTDHLPELFDLFYYLPNTEDILFDLGVYFHEQEDYDRAITYYKESKKYFELSYSVCFNLGYCYYELEQYELALESINESLEYSPNDTDALEYQKKIKQQLLPA